MWYLFSKKFTSVLSNSQIFFLLKIPYVNEKSELVTKYNFLPLMLHFFRISLISSTFGFAYLSKKLPLWPRNVIFIILYTCNRRKKSFYGMKFQFTLVLQFCLRLILNTKFCVERKCLHKMPTTTRDFKKN